MWAQLMKPSTSGDWLNHQLLSLPRGRPGESALVPLETRPHFKAVYSPLPPSHLIGTGKAFITPKFPGVLGAACQKLGGQTKYVLLYHSVPDPRDLARHTLSS